MLKNSVVDRFAEQKSENRVVDRSADHLSKTSHYRPFGELVVDDFTRRPDNLYLQFLIIP